MRKGYAFLGYPFSPKHPGSPVHLVLFIVISYFSDDSDSTVSALTSIDPLHDEARTNHQDEATPIRQASRRRCCALLAVSLLVGLAGCRSFATNDLNDRLIPSNFRDWSPELAVLPFVAFDEENPNLITVHHVRNNSYLSETDFTIERSNRSYDLSQIRSVDFFVVPFEGLEFMAHTMISFGFENEEYLCVSAEIRTERGEDYSALSGITRQFEITYVVADERDLVRLRTRHRDADVYLYRTIATPELAKELFLDVAQRVNQLAERPEFYDTLTNNCTTNIVSHVNRVIPNRVPYSIQVLLPGFSDRYAYELGLLGNQYSFEQLKQQAWINDLAEQHYDAPDFSQKIRERILLPSNPTPGPAAPSTMGLVSERDTSPSNQDTSVGNGESRVDGLTNEGQAMGRATVIPSRIDPQPESVGPQARRERPSPSLWERISLGGLSRRNSDRR